MKPSALRGGFEHDAYFIGDALTGWRILKVTRRPRGTLYNRAYGLNPDAISYLRRLDKMNSLAPGLDYKILGVAPRGTWPCIVSSMRHIHGVEPTGTELHFYMTKRLGFKDEGNNSYWHPSGIRLGDVHTGNFLATGGGRMVPIDVTYEEDRKI